jgi:hypothetical protein
MVTQATKWTAGVREIVRSEENELLHPQHKPRKIREGKREYVGTNKIHMNKIPAGKVSAAGCHLSAHIDHLASFQTHFLRPQLLDEIFEIAVPACMSFDVVYVCRAHAPPLLAGAEGRDSDQRYKLSPRRVQTP